MNDYRDIFTLHSAQKVPFAILTGKNPPKISVLACGARWGKDRLCIGIMLTVAQKLANSERKRRGSKGLIPRVLCWYVAPTFALLRQAWDEITTFAAIIPGIKLNRAQMRVFLPGDIQIEFKSADKPGSLLARGLDLVVVTEAARVKKEAWENAISTRLTSPGRGPEGKGGMAILNSTPNGRNWFYDIYRQAAQDTTGFMRAWTFTSYDNCGVDRKLLDLQRELLPDRVFRQEYLAEFIDSGGSVFRRVQDSLQEYSYPATTTYRVTIGIDWGRYNDRTAAVAVAHEGDQYRVIGDLLLERMDYDRQIQNIKNFAEKYHSAQIIAEANSLGDPLIHSLKKATQKRIIPFTTTAASKRQIVDAAATLMEQGAIVLPGRKQHGVIVSAAKELTDELAQFEVIETRGGHIGYSAPSGLHDDLVMAFCFAISGRETARISGRLATV